MFELLSLCSCIFTGLFAGALLTEAGILVPYWRKMAPGEFLALHHTMAPSLQQFFTPLTILGALLPTITLVAGWLSGTTPNLYWWVSATLAASALAFYFGFFKSANQRFADGKDPAEAKTTLAQWARWHNLRTLFAILAFATCVRAYKMI